MDKYNRKQVLDFSSFFLAEFSDDSEADKAAVMVEAEEDNDDAQSSCNDSNPDHEIELCGDGYAFQDCDTVERPWEEVAEEEEEGEVNMSAKRRRSNSKTCIQGRGRYQQPLNEIERSKIFWETCFASGF